MDITIIKIYFVPQGVISRRHVLTQIIDGLNILKSRNVSSKTSLLQLRDHREDNFKSGIESFIVASSLETWYMTRRIFCFKIYSKFQSAPRKYANPRFSPSASALPDLLCKSKAILDTKSLFLPCYCAVRLLE